LPNQNRLLDVHRQFREVPASEALTVLYGVVEVTDWDSSYAKKAMNVLTSMMRFQSQAPPGTRQGLIDWLRFGNSALTVSWMERVVLRNCHGRILSWVVAVISSCASLKNLLWICFDWGEMAARMRCSRRYPLRMNLHALGSHPSWISHDERACVDDCLLQEI